MNEDLKHRIVLRAALSELEDAIKKARTVVAMYDAQRAPLTPEEEHDKARWERLIVESEKVLESHRDIRGPLPTND